MRISTGLKGNSFRETRLCEHFGRADKVALTTCLKHFNVSDAFLNSDKATPPHNLLFSTIKKSTSTARMFPRKDLTSRSVFVLQR